MALVNPYHQEQYRQQQVNTSTPDKLLLMLYDGAIRFCNQAKLAINEKDLPAAHTAIVKVQNIIEEFMKTLNMDYEVSQNLFVLYEYLLNRLVEANLQKDPVILDEVVGFLTDLRQTWAQAAVLAKGEKGALTGGVSIEG